MNILTIYKDNKLSDIIYCPPKSWEDFFFKSEDKLKFIEERIGNKNYLPSVEKVFRCFYCVPFDKIKVVIIGQDPYHTKGVATGVAFECYNKPNPSLVNIFNNLEKTVKDFVRPKTGDMTKWLNQGVFLYNTALTVLEGLPASHSKDWRIFTEGLFDYFKNNKKNIVYICWGAHARKLITKYIDANNNCILETSHPSPLSAKHGFIDSNLFNEANDYLIKINVEPIDWNLI